MDLIADVAVPLGAAGIGAASALAAGFLTIEIPRRPHQRRVDRTTEYVLDAFRESAQAASAAIIVANHSAAYQSTLSDRIARLLAAMPEIVAHLALDTPDQRRLFGLMMVELDRRSRSLDRRGVRFAAAAGAAISLLKRDDEAGPDALILAEIVRAPEADVSDFFGEFVRRALPRDLAASVAAS
jgi:hypothetical protein